MSTRVPCSQTTVKIPAVWLASLVNRLLHGLSGELPLVVGRAVASRWWRPRWRIGGSCTNSVARIPMTPGHLGQRDQETACERARPSAFTHTLGNTAYVSNERSRDDGAWSSMWVCACIARALSAIARSSGPHSAGTLSLQRRKEPHMPAVPPTVSKCHAYLAQQRGESTIRVVQIGVADVGGEDRRRLRQDKPIRGPSSYLLPDKLVDAHRDEQVGRRSSDNVGKEQLRQQAVLSLG